MANPAFKRSGEKRTEAESPAQPNSQANSFANQTTTDLIALRDALLEECLDLESRPQDPGDADESTPDPALIREKIDEIHQELAMRDLAERVGGRAQPPVVLPAEDRTAGNPALAYDGARKSTRILEAIEMRSRFLDGLAQAAKEQGRLDQAAAFTLDAQRLDMERIQVLCRFNTLAEEETDRED